MLNLDNYTQEKLTIDIAKANIYAIIIALPIGLVYGLLYGVIWHDQFTATHLKDFLHSLPNIYLLKSGLFLAIFFGGIFAHELIHGLTWAMYASNGFKSIKFGVMWKMITPYCHCKEPLTIKQYITGALTPAVILGLFPAIYGIAVGNIGWLLFGFFFTIAASGDFMIVYLLRKESMKNLVQDHPSEAGCYVFRKKLTE